MHDASSLGITPAAQVARVAIRVHADRITAAASLGRVSSALEVTGGGTELVRIVGVHAAEALKVWREHRERRGER